MMSAMMEVECDAASLGGRDAVTHSCNDIQATQANNDSDTNGSSDGVGNSGGVTEVSPPEEEGGELVSSPAPGAGSGDAEATPQPSGSPQKKAGDLVRSAGASFFSVDFLNDDRAQRTVVFKAPKPISEKTIGEVFEKLGESQRGDVESLLEQCEDLFFQNKVAYMVMKSQEVAGNLLEKLTQSFADGDIQVKFFSPFQKSVLEIDILPRLGEKGARNVSKEEREIREKLSPFGSVRGIARVVLTVGKVNITTARVRVEILLSQTRNLPAFISIQGMSCNVRLVSGEGRVAKVCRKCAQYGHLEHECARSYAQMARSRKFHEETGQAVKEGKHIKPQNQHARTGKRQATKSRAKRCFKCGEPGHLAATCEYAQPVCYACKEPGHRRGEGKCSEQSAREAQVAPPRSPSESTTEPTRHTQGTEAGEAAESPSQTGEGGQQQAQEGEGHGTTREPSTRVSRKRQLDGPGEEDGSQPKAMRRGYDLASGAMNLARRIGGSFNPLFSIENEASEMQGVVEGSAQSGGVGSESANSITQPL